MRILSLRSEVLHEKLIIAQPVKNFPQFVEPEDLLLCSKELANVS